MHTSAPPTNDNNHGRLCNGHWHAVLAVAAPPYTCSNEPCAPLQSLSKRHADILCTAGAIHDERHNLGNDLRMCLHDDHDMFHIGSQVQERSSQARRGEPVRCEGAHVSASHGCPRSCGVGSTAVARAPAGVPARRSGCGAGSGSGYGMMPNMGSTKLSGELLHSVRFQS